MLNFFFFEIRFDMDRKPQSETKQNLRPKLKFETKLKDKMYTLLL